MTKSTDSRQLGMVFQAILEKHGLWDYAIQNGKDLLVEMDLVGAAKMYFADVNKVGAVGVRQKIFDAMCLAAGKVAELDAMTARVKSALGINPGGSAWEDVLAFLVREDKKGITIELFAKLCEDDKFNMPKAHQIAMKPKLIMDMWPRLSDKSEARKTDELRPEYKPYIPPSDDGLVSNPFSRNK